MSSKHGESWVGGDFLATDRVIVWNSTGTAFVYRLPNKYNKIYLNNSLRALPGYYQRTNNFFFARV